ncbi:hypothetical protein PTKIN_Ptkin02bG0228000 [Pterospermum kingtungense]
MEGNPTSDGNLIPAGQAFDFLDSQSLLQLHQGLNPQFYQQGLPSIGKPYESVKKLASGNNGINFDEESSDGCYDSGKEKGEFLWQRVKWTEKMVKLLINLVYYIEEDASDCVGGVRRKPSMLQKIGKWRCVSKLMVERGYRVSPQQCEDKFNDLNKRYKRLNDVLGRGTSCKVVENPALLDRMNVSDKVKEEVKKMLSSKNLFYEEMCSYHSRNRLHLPHDPELQRSLQLALGSRHDNEPNRSRQHTGDEEFEKEQQDAGADDQLVETVDQRGTPRLPELSSKRSKQMNEMKDVIIGNPLKIKEYGRSSGAAKQDDRLDANHVYPNDSSAARLQKQWMAFRLLQLKEQKLQIEAQKLEVEKQQAKWQRINWDKGRVLDKMRLENECFGIHQSIGLKQNFKRSGYLAEYNGANSGFPAVSAMWLKLTNENNVAGLGNPSKPWNSNRTVDAQPLYNATHHNLSFPEGYKADGSQSTEAICACVLLEAEVTAKVQGKRIRI